MSAKKFQLETLKGPSPGHIFPLLSISITIGRDPMSDIALNDPEVSRQHARLTQTDEGYLIQDLGSTNGTYVDGNRLDNEPVLLSPGQEIALGSGVVLHYQAASEVEATGATLIDASLQSLVDEPAAPPETADLPPLPELGKEVVEPTPYSEPGMAPPPDPPPPLVPASDNGGAKRKRKMTIAIVATLVLICFCCAFLYFMYQWGGDWLLEQLDLLP